MGPEECVERRVASRACAPRRRPRRGSWAGAQCLLRVVTACHLRVTATCPVTCRLQQERTNESRPNSFLDIPTQGDIFWGSAKSSQECGSQALELQERNALSVCLSVCLSVRVKKRAPLRLQSRLKARGRTARPAHGCCVARAAAAGGFHGPRTRRRVAPRSGRRRLQRAAHPAGTASSRAAAPGAALPRCTQRPPEEAAADCAPAVAPYSGRVVCYFIYPLAPGHLD